MIPTEGDDGFAFPKRQRAASASQFACRGVLQRLCSRAVRVSRCRRNLCNGKQCCDGHPWAHCGDYRCCHDYRDVLLDRFGHALPRAGIRRRLSRKTQRAWISDAGCQLHGHRRFLGMLVPARRSSTRFRRDAAIDWLLSVRAVWTNQTARASMMLALVVVGITRVS